MSESIDTQEQVICDRCGRTFTGCRSTSYSDHPVSVGISGAPGRQLYVDQAPVGNTKFVVSNVTTTCPRCVHLSRYASVSLATLRSRDIHRSFLVALGQQLTQSKDPVCTLEAAYLKRILEAFPAEWISIDSIQDHPSAGPLAHLMVDVPIGIKPDTKIQLGLVQWNHQVGISYRYLTEVIDRLEQADFGVVDTDIQAANEATIAASDGLLQGLYQLGPTPAVNTPNARVMMANAFVAVYPPGTNENRTLVILADTPHTPSPTQIQEFIKERRRVPA